MSALSEPTPSSTEPIRARGRRSRSSRPELRSVAPQVAPLRQLPFLLVLAGVLGLGMAGLLVLNTTVQNQSFDLAEKRATATRLGYTEAALQHELDQVSSPRSLTLKATTLGMRPNAQPAFLLLPDGTVVGPEHAADGKDFPSALEKSQAQLEAEKRAAEQKQAQDQKEAEEQRKADQQKQKQQERQKQKQQDEEKKKQQDQRDGGE